MKMQTMITAILAASLLIFVQGKTPTSTLPGCFLPKACGGSSKVKCALLQPLRDALLALFLISCHLHAFVVVSKRPVFLPVVSASIPSKVINGKTVAFFACQCINGTRFAVNSDASIMIPLAKVPAQAPPPRPIAPAPATIAVPTITPTVGPKAAPGPSRAGSSLSPLRLVSLLGASSPPLFL